MEVVIDYEYVFGAHGEEAIKEVSVASENFLGTFRFLPPHSMDDHSSDLNGISWSDGIIDYHYSKH
jgi:hypothetical protein